MTPAVRASIADRMTDEWLTILERLLELDYFYFYVVVPGSATKFNLRDGIYSLWVQRHIDATLGLVKYGVLLFKELYPAIKIAHLRANTPHVGTWAVRVRARARGHAACNDTDARARGRLT